ncbi:MAG TPA: glycosyltransferase 87 family protein [Chloroflexota bacterium]|nr:glycosyltransferase 87 family protein [Chloroflexota bacterium]
MLKRHWAAGLVALIALGAAALKLFIARTTYGSSDVWYWETYLTMAREVGAIELYRTEEHFNHPPFTTYALLGLGWLADRTGLGFPFWLRVPATLADAGNVFILWRLMRARFLSAPAGRGGYLSLALLAAAPASVMISGFHGNTDPVVMGFLLLSVYLWEARRSAALAGAALGMAINIKVVPLVFLPALFLYVSGWRRFLYIAVAGAVVFVASLPYILQDPAIINQKVLGYGSYYGHWGLSRILQELASEGAVAAALNRLFLDYGRYVALGLPALAAAVMNGPHLLLGWPRPPLYVQCGVVASLFLGVSPGFGPQYLAWVVPWAPGAGALAAGAFYVASGVFLFAVYTYWAGAFPWYTADARPYEFEWWSRPIVNLELLTWASVIVVLGALVSVAAGRMRR